MRILLTLTLACGLIAGGTGCSPASIAKRGIEEIRGASSKARPIPGSAGGRFSRFGGVQIASPHTDLGGLVDARFRSVLPVALRRALTEGEGAPFRGGAPLLSIEPEIAWYHKAGGLGGLMGSDSFAVALFWLKADGADLGRIEVVTKSAAMRTSPEDMAKSMAGALAKYFKKRRKK